MSDTQHTPGPWIITRFHHSPASIEARDTYGGALAKVYLTDPKTHRRTPEYLANARLIAAAPDLLAALQAVAEYWAGGDVPADIDAAIRAAIAKAAGQ